MQPTIIRHTNGLATSLCMHVRVCSRPSAPVHEWSDIPGVIAGRDLQAGGTWCGVHRETGRVAWLTNLRAFDPDPGEGTLPVRTR